MIKKFILVSTLLLFFAATYAEPNPNSKGPTYDLSKIQPEFRIGFLGDEAAQDIIARNPVSYTHLTLPTTPYV